MLRFRGTVGRHQTPAAPHLEAERRKGGRVRSTGTAVVHGAFAAHARIFDLSIGGVSLLIDEAAELPAVGAHVRLDVRLDGFGCWFHLAGSVARIDVHDSGCALVIELLAVPQDFEDLVQDELLSELECAQLPQILLVDSVCGHRDTVAAAFRATGCHVIEVSSPLEAIAELDQSQLYLWAVVTADTEAASRADELRTFLGEMYPAVPLIDIGHRDLASQIFHIAGTPEPLGGAV